MQQILYKTDKSTNIIGLLCKESSFRERELQRNYVIPLLKQNVKSCDIIAYSLAYQTSKKCNATFAKKYLETLLPDLITAGIKILFITDTIYFKILTKLSKITLAYGYLHSCKLTGYEDFQAILVPNYQAVVYNPTLQVKIDGAIQTLASVLTQTYNLPGTDIIKFAEYPHSIASIEQWLHKLHSYKRLTCDIETRGLKFYNCGISTISFAWSEHEGIAFAIDRQELAISSTIIKQHLRKFFESYKGILVFHNANFDCKVLVYSLYMQNLGDYVGMVNGINTFGSQVDDTKLIAYLAINNTIDTSLGLKTLAADFAGDYGEKNIEDTEAIPLDRLLEYNLKDCLCTWYVYNKYHPIMVQDQQEQIYLNLFKPAIKTVMQMELCGMPIDITEVHKLRTFLENEIKAHNTYFQNSDIISQFHYKQLCLKAEAATAKAKKKIYTIDDPVIAFDFNPNSDQQLQKLIYNYMGYTPIDFTKSKAPATGTKTLTKLINHATCSEHKEIFQQLIDHALADKILSSFIPAFETAQQLPNGSWQLYGSFGLGATKSGRMNSSNPNLQNIPSNSRYGKAVKKCFISPKGWLFVGSDFDSLEDRINTLITKDPNKLKVYTGHVIYELCINNTCHYIRDDTVINYDGKSYTGEEFYEAYCTL